MKPKLSFIQFISHWLKLTSLHLSIFLTFILISKSSIAQVVIKEKVEINPQVIQSDNPQVNARTVRFEIEWAAVVVPANNHFYNANLRVKTEVKDNCENILHFNDWTYGWPSGTKTININNANAYHYNLNIGFRGFYDEYQFVDLTYRIFVDDFLERSGSLQIMSRMIYYYDDRYVNISYSSPPLISDYSLRFSGNRNFCYSESKDIQISTYGNYCETGVSWNPATEPLTLTIESGNEFVSFYNRQGNKLGDNLTGLYDEIRTISIKQDSLYSGTEDKYVVVQSEWAGVIKADSMRIISLRGEYLVAEPDKDTLIPGEEILVIISSSDCRLPYGPTYSAEILSGNEYGKLYDFNTGEYVQGVVSGRYIFGLGRVYIWYKADGEPVDSVVSVTIRISTSDPNIPYKDLILYIKPSPLIVTVYPEFVSPGDTAVVIIKRKNDDGILVDFPEWQTFEVGMLDGCALGKIHAGGVDTNYIYDVPQPILFVADTSAEGGIVKLRVGLIGEFYGSSMNVRDKDKDEEQAQEKEQRRIAFEKMMREKRKSQPTLTPENTESFCFIGNYQSSFYKDVNVVKKKYELEILEPFPNSIAWITPEPRMPTVTCKAQLKNYNKGTVTFEWEYWVSYEFERRNKSKGGSYYNLCSRIGKTVFLGWSYSQNDETTSWQVPFLRDSGYYYYKAIWYKDRTDLHPAYGCDKSYTVYEGGNEVFTGGKVLVIVTAYDIQGKILAEDTLSAGKLLGKNEEDLNRVYSYAFNKEIIAIIQHESRTKQFETNGYWYPMYEKGWPVYGYPNGYGLMQIDNPAAVEEQLWNWKSNIEGGKKIFNGKKKDALADFLKWKVPANAPDRNKYLLINSYQYYNSGKPYYKFIDGVWERNRYLDHDNNYGEIVYKKYLQLNP